MVERKLEPLITPSSRWLDYQRKLVSFRDNSRNNISLTDRI